MSGEQQEQDYRRQLENWREWLDLPQGGWVTDGGEESFQWLTA